MVKELIKKVGKECYIYFDGLKVKCKVKDIRVNFGRKEYLITPTDGSGETWKRDVFFEKNLNQGDDK